MPLFLQLPQTQSSFFAFIFRVAQTIQSMYVIYFLIIRVTLFQRINPDFRLRRLQKYLSLWPFISVGELFFVWYLLDLVSSMGVSCSENDLSVVSVGSLVRDTLCGSDKIFRPAGRLEFMRFQRDWAVAYSIRQYH